MLMNFVNLLDIITPLFVFDISVGYLLMFVNGNLEATDSTRLKIVSVAAIDLFPPAAVRWNKTSCQNKD